MQISSGSTKPGADPHLTVTEQGHWQSVATADDFYAWRCHTECHPDNHDKFGLID
jgi:hypothetical protein